MMTTKMQDRFDKLQDAIDELERMRRNVCSFANNNENNKKKKKNLQRSIFQRTLISTVNVRR
jgi:hypothetical protein